MKKYKLDKEEKAILKSIEAGEWKAYKPTEKELKRYAEMAKNTLKKNQRMNIRISKADLSGIKARAAEEGIPYQTLVASLIHNYVTGRVAA